MEIKIENVTMETFYSLSKFIKSKKNIIDYSSSANEKLPIISLMASKSYFRDVDGNITFELRLHITKLPLLDDVEHISVRETINCLFDILGYKK